MRQSIGTGRRATIAKLDVARFHDEYDHHPDDRIRLFGAVAKFVRPAAVLYPGSYVDIAPSVFFDDVRYVDVDRRAGRFFSQGDDVRRLIADKRREAGREYASFSVQFEHLDYTEPLSIADRSIDLLISLYAGFISEACTRYLAPGGHLLANDSHGDASMASLDRRYELVAVVTSSSGGYRVSTVDLDSYLVPKRGASPTAEELRTSGRGPRYAKSPFAYLFRRTGSA